jgi:TonB family protein
MSEEKTHYDTLEVVEWASAEVIRGAHKHLSQKWHPDKNPEDPRLSTHMASVINAAHHVLGNAQRRAHYDAQLKNARGRAASASQSSGPSPAGQTTAKDERHQPPPSSEAPPSQAKAPPSQANASKASASKASPSKRSGRKTGFWRFAIALVATSAVIFVLAVWGSMGPEKGVVDGPGSSQQVTASVDAARPALARTKGSQQTPRKASPHVAKASGPLPAVPAKKEIAETTPPYDAPNAPPKAMPTVKPASVGIYGVHYPPAAVRENREGRVIVTVVVDPDGRILSRVVSRTSGWPDLDEAAMAGRPVVSNSGSIDGESATTSVDVPVDFTL